MLHFALKFPDTVSNDDSASSRGVLSFLFCYRSCRFVLSIHSETVCLLQNPLSCMPFRNVYICLIKSERLPLARPLPPPIILR
jgi:hypothetical protein